MTKPRTCLYVDTSDREKISIKINDKHYETKAKKDCSQKLLPFIDEILASSELSINDITEVKVNTGPGSFTGLRVGIAISNALGFALNIPVNGKKIEKQINY